MSSHSGEASTLAQPISDAKEVALFTGAGREHGAKVKLEAS